MLRGRCAHKQHRRNRGHPCSRREGSQVTAAGRRPAQYSRAGRDRRRVDFVDEGPECLSDSDHAVPIPRSEVLRGSVLQGACLGRGHRTPFRSQESRTDRRRDQERGLRTSMCEDCSPARTQAAIDAAPGVSLWMHRVSTSICSSVPSAATTVRSTAI